MPYKIVKTIENGSYMLTTIPDPWESGGVLYWPLTNSSLNKLRKKEDSIPEINWKKINCVVKKSGILSYAEARFIEKELSELTSSEAEQNIDNHNQRKRVYSGQINEIKQLQNFDYMFPKPETEHPVANTPISEALLNEPTMEPTASEVNTEYNTACDETVHEVIDISILVQHIDKSKFPIIVLFHIFRYSFLYKY